MLKKHIVLFESKDYGWIAYSTTGADAKRILRVNNNYNIFYIFECNLLQKNPYTMKLKTPLDNYFDCKVINKYKEDNFIDEDNFLIVSYNDEDEENSFNVSNI